MAGKRYTKEEREFILSYSKTHTRKETSERFNELFGRSSTPQSISLYVIYHGGSDRKCVRYTKEQDDWLKENFPKYERSYICKEFNDKFGTNRTPGAIAVHCCADLHIVKTDDVRKQIVKETHPSALPIGTISKRKFSDKSPRCELLWIKVKDSTDSEDDTRKDWIPLARYIWETYHGPIPEGYVLMHLDRDYCKCRIENLVLLSTK